jgi:hypothetical protein
VENWEKTFPQGEFLEALSWRQVSTDLASGCSSRSHRILVADGSMHFGRLSVHSHSKTLVSIFRIQDGLGLVLRVEKEVLFVTVNSTWQLTTSRRLMVC